MDENNKDGVGHQPTAGGDGADEWAPILVYESDALTITLEDDTTAVLVAEGYETEDGETRWPFGVVTEGRPGDLSTTFAETGEFMAHPAIAKHLAPLPTPEADRVSLKRLAWALSVAGLTSRCFGIVTGLLCEHEALGVALHLRWDPGWQLRLEVHAQGAVVSRIPVTIKRTDKRTHYLQVATSKATSCPVLGRLLPGRIPWGATKAIPLHVVVAVVGEEADLSEGAAAHHRNFNGGDNRIVNIFVLSTATHDELHLQVVDNEAFLAEAERLREELPLLPEHIQLAVEADLERLTGRPFPRSVADQMVVAVRSKLLQDVRDPAGSGEEGYNPLLTPITDLSQDFSKGFMVVSSSFPEVRPVLDDEGEPQKDVWGRTQFQTLWRPRTVTSTGTIIEAEDELPDELSPAKPFALEGLKGTPRWAKEDMDRFAAGHCPDPRLAARLVQAIDGRVAFARPGHLALVAAYVLLTYLFGLLRRAPFLHLHSPVAGAGKSTAQEVLSKLCFNAVRMALGSLAVTVRLVNQARCTLILDEQENLASRRAGGDLIELLNSRSDAGSTYQILGTGHVPQSFDVFGPTIISNLGGLPDTLRTRSFNVEMRPMLPNDPRQYSYDEGSLKFWLQLRGELYLWTAANWKAVKETYEMDPTVRVGSNRHADLWRPILAVGKHFLDADMFETLLNEAVETSKTVNPDDVNDAVLLSLDDFLKASIQLKRPFEKSLSEVHERACGKLEEDQTKLLSTKKVAALCRMLGLTVSRSSKFNGANSVRCEHPESVRQEIRTRYPHLV